MSELRKWTLFVRRDDPAGVIEGAERGHTDTDDTDSFEAVWVTEVPYITCEVCGGKIMEVLGGDHICSPLLQPHDRRSHAGSQAS